MYHYEEEGYLENLENRAKVFFQVLIDYNKELIKDMVPEGKADQVNELGPMESRPLKTLDEADEMSDDMTTKIHDKFPGSEIRKLEPEEQEDEYSILVINKDGLPIARLGIVATDYSEATIH